MEGIKPETIIESAVTTTMSAFYLTPSESSLQTGLPKPTYKADHHYLHQNTRSKSQIFYYHKSLISHSCML